MIQRSNKLTAKQAQFYEENGYLFPVRVFSEEVTTEFRRQFDDYTQQNQERLKGLIPRQRRAIYSETHLFLPWVYEMVSDSRVLDAVEGVIGPNILAWESAWFVKFPHDKSFVSWHQDGVYWGLHPPKVTTAWVALCQSIPENGCMQVMPGTHKVDFQHKDTYAQDNALSRGQELAVQVDQTKAVNLVLQPGEMSLHHVGVAHGSGANNSDHPRIGIAIRYIAPEVLQDGVERQIVQLVRGRDEFGHFDIVDPPKEGTSSVMIREEADRRLLRNILGGTKQ